jgi:Protein of unknown function (DUF3300)
VPEIDQDQVGLGCRRYDPEECKMEAIVIATSMRLLAAALWLASPDGALAQNTAPAPAPSPPPAQAPADATQQLSDGQLDALVAPIALYPDALLSEVLMASTYPLEVVEADRFAKDNKALKGDALKAAVDQQSWDDSVKSLVATPDVLAMMSQKLSWTQSLGDAVLAQQPDVMDAIQRLRGKAQANNKLVSNQQQTVTTQQQAGKEVIVIAPTQPNTVYVPYYNPSVVYGPWPYPSYPPYYWPAPGYIAGGLLATGLAFGAGYALGRWASGGYWGGGVNWGNNNININRNTNINNINRGGGNNWTHNPAHRQGVRYNNPSVANRFGGNRGAGAQNRMDFRGRGGNQVLNPGGGGLGGGGLGGAGNRPNVGGGGAGNRPNIGGGAGNRPGGDGANRPSVGGGGNRPSAGGGNRPSAGGGNRPSLGGGGRSPGGALGGISSGGIAGRDSARGRASLGGGGGGGFRGGGGGGGGGFRGGGGGGGGRGGGGGGRGGGGGGRRSDIRLKHDIVWLGRLDDGLGFYRFTYNGGDKPYVGVMAQEVQQVAPQAVTTGADGYLRVHYEKLGLRFQTYDQWLASGAKLPATTPPAPAAH